jgi:hypothetical protein
LVERDISGDSVFRNNIYLKRLAPPVNLLNGKGSQVSPSAHFPLLPSPAPLGVSEANPAELAALPAIHIVLKERVNHDIALSSERDEVDRKKRHAADTTHFLFDSIHSLEKTSDPRGVLFIREIALEKSE